MEKAGAIADDADADMGILAQAKAMCWRAHIAPPAPLCHIDKLRIAPGTFGALVGLGIRTTLGILVAPGISIPRDGSLRERGGLCGDFLVALARLGATGALGIHHGRIGAVGGGVVAGLLGGDDIALALKVGIPLIVEQGGHGASPSTVSRSSRTRAMRSIWLAPG